MEVNVVRKREKLTAEPPVSLSSAFEVEMAVEKPKNNQITRY